MTLIERKARDLDEYGINESYQTNPTVKRWVSEYLYTTGITKQQMLGKLINDLVKQNNLLIKDRLDYNERHGIATHDTIIKYIDMKNKTLPKSNQIPYPPTPPEAPPIPYDRDRDNPFKDYPPCYCIKDFDYGCQCAKCCRMRI